MIAPVSFAAAFFGGLVSFLSPCVLPLVPAYVGYVSGVYAADVETPGARGRAVRAATAFVAGFSLVFVGLGASATLLGRLVEAHLDQLSLIAGCFVTFMGAHFLSPRKWWWLSRSATLAGGGGARAPGLWAGFTLGMAFAFGWTPCAGPVLASVLFLAGAEATVMRGVALLAAYSAGLGAPFLLAAFAAGSMQRMLAPARRWGHRIEQASGAFLMLLGLAMLTNALPAIAMRLLDWFPVLGRIG